MSLVYGGGNVGLMGIIADEVLKHNQKVIGVIPSFLMEREVGHTGISEMIITDTMHERKKIMMDKADIVITLPGGYGTFEELFEALTWAQLGLHNTPIGILNINGYYDGLIAQIQNMVDSKFLKPFKPRNVTRK